MIDWIMYAKIQDLKRQKYKKARVAKKLRINRETVTKYWDMTPEEYEATCNKHRERKPDRYKSQIVEWLMDFPDMTAAQIYDWLKERNQVETLDFQKRSFQDYVNSIRKEYDIKKPETTRQYEASDERAPGEQGQIDMGEISVLTPSGRHKKVYCFAMVLSHSRYKYVLWQERPFTTDTFIRAHIKAFEFLEGRPKEIVYDQDKILAVSENHGDIIYTAGFQSYLDEVKFSVYLCHGADPESKGPVENVVRFAKHGFAEHRTLTDIESFNKDCLAWLRRTANHDIHGTTRKRPDEVFALEKEYLIPVSAYSFTSATNESISYPVRKDNIVLYKGNRYRVPVGTYHKGIRVYMNLNEETDELSITDIITGEIYAKHPLCHEKGRLIGQSERSYRDKSTSVIAQEETLKELFDNDELVGPFLEHIHQAKPRYYRDQLGVIKQLFEEWNQEDILKGLHYCSEKELYSAGDLKSSIIYLNQTKLNKRKTNTRDSTVLPEKYRGDNPEIRDLSVYEEAMNGVLLMDKIKVLQGQAATLSLYNTRDKLEELVHKAEQEEISYLTFIEDIFSGEIKYRHDKAMAKRIKEAGFPYEKYLKDFDLTFCNSLSKKQFIQLSELTWIDGIYNLILSGPPGVGKTHLAIGLGYHACEEGYKVSYTTMQSLVQCLRTEEIDRRSRCKMNRIRKSNLLVIDEVGYLPINATEGNLFFQLISELQEQTSIIITTNKGFEEWTEFLGDPALATAILDRLSYRCDRIKISGKSYRLENRKSFLKEGETADEI